jgi:kynurenine formamidase
MRSRKQIYWILLAALVVAFISIGAGRRATLNGAWHIIRDKEFVDLTHSFEPGIPHWPGFDDEQRELLYWYDDQPPGPGTKGTGFYAQLYMHVGQWGTHVDPPAHFIRGLRTVDQIDVKEMIMPLVVIDVHDKVAQNPDYTLTMEDIRAWEKKYGRIPSGAFVAMRTDWSKRWPDAKRRRRWHRALSWLELAGATIPLRRARNHRFGS